MAASKECRLCARAAGPFFNIFGLEVDLASRIKDLLPFEIDEWDNLPHKICYRCSAKVAELFEFVQKCKVTQEYFCKKFGKNVNKYRNKSKRARDTWEASLQAKKISNDKYCDELIKKAIQSLPELDDADDKSIKPANDSKMKRAKVVLSRSEANDFINKQNVQAKKNESAEPASKTQNDDLNDNIAFLDVSNVNSIYTCKICNKFFTIKEKIKSHACKEKSSQDTEKNSIEKSQPDKDKINESHPNTADVSPNLALVEQPKLLTRSSKKRLSLKNKNSDENPLKLNNVEQEIADKKPNKATVIPLSNSSNLFVVQLPNGEYVVLQNPRNDTLTPTPIQFNNMEHPNYLPNTTITNTNVTINAPYLYDKNKLPIGQTNRRLENQEEPYPVGLFCRSSNDINILQNEHIDPIKVGKSPDKMVDMNFQNKQYQIMPHQKPGKLVIKTTTVDRNGVSDNSHRIKKKKKAKPKKMKVLKNYVGFDNMDASQSNANENFSADDDKPIYTFINIDPMSNPGYVLPTSNTLQESQISTTATPASSGKSKKIKLTIGNKNSDKMLPIKSEHKCYICDLVFSGHNKLVSHIDTHFNDDFKPEVTNKTSKKKNKR